jgi:Asp-tRNA(Asn)/Glu-tRNA(Gln) amidotransferase A subunit family amidase
MDGTRLGASELARHIGIGAVSPVELVASLLERIERPDPVVKAWVSVDVEESRRIAAVREAEVRDGTIGGRSTGCPLP